VPYISYKEQSQSRSSFQICLALHARPILNYSRDPRPDLNFTRNLVSRSLQPVQLLLLKIFMKEEHSINSLYLPSLLHFICGEIQIISSNLDSRCFQRKMLGNKFGTKKIEESRSTVSKGKPVNRKFHENVWSAVLRNLGKCSIPLQRVRTDALPLPTYRL